MRNQHQRNLFFQGPIQLREASGAAALRGPPQVRLRALPDPQADTAPRRGHRQGALAYLGHLRPQDPLHVLALQALAVERTDGQAGVVSAALTAAETQFPNTVPV